VVTQPNNTKGDYTMAKKTGRIWRNQGGTSALSVPPSRVISVNSWRSVRWRKLTGVFGPTVVLLVVVLGCGSPAEPVVEDVEYVETRNTTAHMKSRGTWEEGVSVSGSWRLVSISIFGVNGSYNLEFTNSDVSSSVTVSYHLRFFDAAGFELARYGDFGDQLRTEVPAGGSTPVTGTFTITSKNSISIANQMSEMIVYASFTFSGT